MDQKISSIHSLEEQNKSKPHPSHKNLLLSLHQELRALLLDSFEKAQSYVLLITTPVIKLIKHWQPAYEEPDKRPRSPSSITLLHEISL